MTLFSKINVLAHFFIAITYPTESLAAFVDFVASLARPLAYVDSKSALKLKVKS